MKRSTFIAAIAVAALSLGLAINSQATTGAPNITEAPAQMSVVQDTAPLETANAGLQMSLPENINKKCSFNSDCSHGKCKSGKCGGCSFNSDCKGWGKCKKSLCGGCSFNSDCKGHGKCSSGQCTKTPYK